MSKKHLIFTVLILFVLSLAGCGSGGGSSSSSSGPGGGSNPPAAGGVAGGGAPAKAFMTGGTVSIEYFNETTGQMAALSGASGSCTNSKISLTLPSDYASSLPLVVSISGATLKTSNGDVTMDASSKLSRLFSTTSELNSLYITIFSTAKAEAWKAARIAGATVTQANNAGTAALEALFSSLGLTGSTLNADNIENVDPTGATSAGALEKAQQSARLVLGIASDEDGLSGLTSKIESKISSKAASAAVSGGTYTASDFITDVSADLGGQTPAAYINTAASQAAIESAVKSTFDNDGGAAGVTSTVAVAESEAVTVDTSIIVAIASDKELITKTYDVALDQTDSATITFKTAANGDGANKQVNATASGGVLLSHDGTTFASSLTDKVLNVDATAGKFAIKIPAGTSVGAHTITLTREPGMTSIITVKVLGSGTATVISTSLAVSSPSYLGFSDSGKVEVPAAAVAAFKAYGSTSAGCPSLAATLTPSGSTTPSSDTQFKIKFTLPSGLVFSGTGMNDSSTFTDTLTLSSAGSWSAASDDLTVTFVDPTVRVSLTGDALPIKATSTKAFGRYVVKVDVYDGSNNVLASGSANLYVINTNSATQIAEVRTLKYNTTTEVDATAHTRSASTVTSKKIELANSFTGTTKTWQQLAGSGDNTATAPDGVVLYETPKTYLGGFYDVSDANRQVNLDIPTNKYTASGGVLTIDPSAEANRWLHITVGGNSEGQQVNYETINLKFWYGSDSADRATSDSSVKFYSNPTP